MKKIVQLFLIASSGFMVTSCYNDALPEPPAPATIVYQKDIQSLFNKNCIGCHKTGSTAPDLTSANSYLSLTTINKEGEYFVTPKDAEGSILYQAMTGNGAPLMPPNGALSKYKLKLVEKWINDGATNN